MDDNIYTEPKLVKSDTNSIFGQYMCPTCSMSISPKDSPHHCKYCGQYLLYHDPNMFSFDPEKYRGIDLATAVQQTMDHLATDPRIAPTMTFAEGGLVP